MLLVRWAAWALPAARSARCSPLGKWSETTADTAAISLSFPTLRSLPTRSALRPEIKCSVNRLAQPGLLLAPKKPDLPTDGRCWDGHDVVAVDH